MLAAAAGARRSEAALPRFLAANQTVDAAVFVESKGPTDDLTEARRELAALSEVRQVFRATGWTTGALILAGADPTEPSRRERQLGVVALDPGGSVVFGRPIMVASRLPDERRPVEVAVDEELAERSHLSMGSRYRVGRSPSHSSPPPVRVGPSRPRGPWSMLESLESSATHGTSSQW